MRYLEQRFAEIEAQHPTAAADNPKKISTILRVAPVRYCGIMATQQIIKGAACTPEDLIGAMEILCRQQAGTQGTQNGGRGHEMALAAPGNRAPTCWNCGRPGHRSADCRSENTSNRFRPPRNGNGNGAGGLGDDGGHGNNNNNSGAGLGDGGRPRRDIVCDESGLRGHTRDRCFCLAANASRRPQGWTPPAGYNGGGGGAEHGHANMDNDGFELVMCQTDVIVGMSVPTSKSWLFDPSIWIGDTGASALSTAHMQGMVNRQDAGSAADILGIGGSAHKVDSIGDVACLVHDKHGNEVTRVTLKGVSYSADNA